MNASAVVVCSAISFSMGGDPVLHDVVNLAPVTALPARLNLCIYSRLEIEPFEIDATHDLRVSVVDEDGRELTGVPFQFHPEVPVGEVVNQWPVLANMTQINVPVMVDHEGRYGVDVLLGHEPIGHAPLRVTVIG